MVAARTSMGETSCLWRFIMDMGFPSSWGRFVSVNMARRANIEIAIAERMTMVARNIIGARGMRERSLSEVGDSY
jgi:hypothetical protein